MQNTSFLFRCNCITTLILLFLSIPSYSAFTEWNGTVDTNWLNSSNWSNGVPGTADEGRINSTANDPVITSNTSISKLNMNGGTLTINSGITLSISIVTPSNNVGVVYTGGGTIELNGTLDIENAPESGIQVDGSGTFNVRTTGAIHIDGVNTINSASHGGINNYGIFLLEQGSSITIGGTTALNGRGIYNTGTFTNNSTISIDNTSNDGLENAGTFNNNAVVDIGVNVGGITGIGFENQNNTLDVGIEGVTIGSVTGYGQIDVVGSVFLSNTLSLSGSYTPIAGNSFIIINNDGFDPITGTFSGLPEGSIISFNGKDLELSYIGGDGNDIVLSLPKNDVPTLSQWGLIILALLFMTFGVLYLLQPQFNKVDR